MAVVEEEVGEAVVGARVAAGVAMEAEEMEEEAMLVVEVVLEGR